MADLFGKVDRTERQELAVQKWWSSKGKASFCFATGFGKTRCALMCIKKLLTKNPGSKILIVVPTEPLKLQWITLLAEWQLTLFCTVQIINSVIKSEQYCDMLVLDEIHKYASETFLNVFSCVRYKAILGLTATMARLDGKEELIKKYAPICDEISLNDAIFNEWLSPYKEYKVLIDVDLTEYNILNQEFYSHFSFFGHNFDLAMKCSTDFRARYNLAKEKCSSNDAELIKDINRQILVHAMGFNKTLQARKMFINSHPRKIELANLILEYRQDKKAITFSPTIKVAEQIKYGFVLSSKQSKKKRACTMDDFSNMKTGALNTSKALDEGADIKGLNLAVILGNTSSSTQKIQRLGRVIRKESNKSAEIFTFVLKGTVEEAWFEKSSGKSEYITIGDDDLLDILLGREVTPKKNKETKMVFRF